MPEIENFLRNDLMETPPHDPSRKTALLIMEEATEGLLAEGLITTPEATEELTKWAKNIFLICHRLSFFPFTSQAELLRETELSKESIEPLNRIIRHSALFQDIILDGGPGRQYWQNTIVPAVQSGGLKSVLNGNFSFPYRVGVWTGVSCMFECSFCGRNYSARYNRDALDLGNENFARLFQDAPKDDANRFYFSGGLEPLTNPGLGSVISEARANGFNINLYTNAYMLTPKTIERQPGLFDLAALRISFYGTNEEKTREVTSRRGAFDIVVDNASSFLAARNVRDASTNMGMNFVILPGHSEDILQLAEVIEGINEKAGGRPLDFLTLREDYSIVPEDGIPVAERQKMIAVFEEFDEIIASGRLGDLHVDYGYALQAIKEGFSSIPLDVVSCDQLPKSGYPQLSVIVDLYGDVFLYREAGFIERPGAHRYIIGRITEEEGLESVVRSFIDSKREIETEANDWRFLDAFDHVMVQLINKAREDQSVNLPLQMGPVDFSTTTDPHGKKAAVWR